MQREKLAHDEFFDEKKIRVVMGAMFLKAWTYVAENEHTFDLPLLIHYSSIDKASSPNSNPVLSHSRYCVILNQLSSLTAVPSIEGLPSAKLGSLTSHKLEANIASCSELCCGYYCLKGTYFPSSPVFIELGLLNS